MAKGRGLKMLLTAPYNSVGEIMEAVGGMHRGEIIQAEIPGRDRVDRIRRRMDERFPATDYMIEHFIYNGRQYVYIYICTKNDFAKGGFNYE